MGIGNEFCCNTSRAPRGNRGQSGSVTARRLNNVLMMRRELRIELRYARPRPDELFFEAIIPKNPVAPAFPGPRRHYEDKSLLLRKNSCAKIKVTLAVKSRLRRRGTQLVS
jgi:hypothetical protein